MGRQVLKCNKEKITSFNYLHLLEEAGFEEKDFKYCHKNEEYYKSDIVEITEICKKDRSLFGTATELKCLKFHKDWNWLMDVYSKLKELGFGWKITSNYIEIFTQASRNRIYHKFIFVEEGLVLQATYISLTEFIKWYNKNDSNKY